MLEYGRLINTEFDIYLSRETVKQYMYPVNLLQLGLNYTIETTKSASESNRKSNELFSLSNKWGLFLAAARLHHFH